ncbi:hypothetical protein FNE72_28955 [Klebsiella pneumoniae]|nr:hypothetical protein FNE72_28955 [Klebsiella pneumoniae]
MDAGYNDIALWDHHKLTDAFGGTDATVKKYSVKTKDEVEKLFVDKEFNAAQKLQVVELHMPREDAPRSLVLTAEASAQNNAKTK